MFIFTCKNRFEDMMCCIYTAWEKAVYTGHEQVRLLVEPIGQETLFDEYIHVDYEKSRYHSVVSTIAEKLSDHILFEIHYVSLSYEEDTLDAIYRFLVKAFSVGPSILQQLTEPTVMRFFELRRAVGNEAHYFREFARFNSLDGNVYVCHLEPKSNVIEIVGQHFADRMPSEHFIIVDDNRHFAVIHPKDEDNYLKQLSPDEMDILSKTELYEDEFTELWRTFVKTIAIKERENPSCQRNLMPLWMRKHATEFL